MKYDVEKEVYDEIAKVIHSDKSPVGIDAKKNTYSYFEQTPGDYR